MGPSDQRPKLSVFLSVYCSSEISFSIPTDQLVYFGLTAMESGSLEDLVGDIFHCESLSPPLPYLLNIEGGGGRGDSAKASAEEEGGRELTTTKWYHISGGGEGGGGRRLVLVLGLFEDEESHRGYG